MGTDLDITAVEQRIVFIRGQRVILGDDLASMYSVPGFRLNRAVKRNRERFPDDFMFQLTTSELSALVAQGILRAQTHGGRRTLPYVFTEHGAVMLANALKSPVAVAASIEIVRAFNRMRRIISANKEIAKKLLELEDKVGTHDVQIQAILAAIRRFLEPPPQPPREIGFKP
jgi:hypothetical protein